METIKVLCTSSVFKPFRHITLQSHSILLSSFVKFFIAFSTMIIFLTRRGILFKTKSSVGMYFMMEGESYCCFILFLRVFKPIEEGKEGFNFFS